MSGWIFEALGIAGSLLLLLSFFLISTSRLAAASAAMEAFARGLAVELAPRRVNTLSPGPIDTPILSKTLGEGRQAYVEALTRTLPLHRLGTPVEAGVFLMANGWMNGAVLNIDGGSRLV